jgi:hypothetical protein
MRGEGHNFYQDRLPLREECGGDLRLTLSGERARELGLVDDLGLLEDAIEQAREMGNAKGAKAVMYKRPYGYRGSIYAETNVPQPQAASNVTKLELPGGPWLPSGFYYLWNP